MKLLLIVAGAALACTAAAIVVAQPATPPALSATRASSAIASHGARCDGSVDDTRAIVAAARSAKGLLVVPAGCRFDRQDLLRTLPPDAVVLDLSTINGFASEGETTKSVGILAADTAANDSQWLIASGHHPVLNLNNFGSAPSQSAEARRASLLWSVGDFTNGASKTGYRGAGILQFGREPGREEWSLSLRSLAPWPAIAARYEMWAPDERIVGPGVYRSTGQVMLVSLKGGVTGRVAPSAGPGGSVVDGTVTWHVADSGDRSIMRISSNGRVLFGLGDFSATFRQKVSEFYPGNNVSEWAAAGRLKDVISKLLPTDASGAEVAVPALRANARNGLAVVDGRDYATPIVQFDSARGMAVSRVAMVGSMARVLGGLVDVSDKSLLFLRSDRRQVLEGLSGGGDGQVVTLHFLDGNTVLANGTARNQMHLEGSTNFTPTADTVLTLRKLPAELGGRWVETSRSVK
jgi:hypothetical protein